MTFLPLSKEHDKRTLAILHAQGIKITRAELIAERKAAYATIRLEMHEVGIDVPCTDVGLYMWLSRNQEQGKVKLVDL